MLRQEVHVHENGVVNSDVDIAVPDCDSACAAAEQLDGDVVVLQEELYPLEGNDSPIVELVGLLGYLVRDLLQLVIEPADGCCSDALLQQALLLCLLRVL